MSLDFTFLGEIITFLLLILFTMKFVWPHLIAAIETREKMVSDAEQQVMQARLIIGKAEEEAQTFIAEAKRTANQIINDAEKYAVQLKNEAQAAADKQIHDAQMAAKHTIVQERLVLQKQLKTDVAKLVITATEAILSSEISQEQKVNFLEKINLS